MDKPVKKRLSHKREKRSKFSVEDFVRLSIDRAPFIKRYQAIWTEEEFIIYAIVYGNLSNYKIMDQDNENTKGKFYEQEFQFIVELKMCRTEKVIQIKK